MQQEIRAVSSLAVGMKNRLPKRTEIWPKTGPFGNGVLSSSSWGIAEKTRKPAAEPNNYSNA